MILSQELRKGTVYKHLNNPYIVLNYSHTQLARGSAIIRVKVKNLLNGVIQEFSYNSSEKFEPVDLVTKNLQYLYSDDSKLYFMDPVTFDEYNYLKDVLDKRSVFLKEGDTYPVILYENSLVTVDLPKVMSFVVTYTEPGFKGNTASNTLKKATIENGLEILVPLFINIGDKIKVNTETLEYRERDR